MATIDNTNLNMTDSTGSDWLSPASALSRFAPSRQSYLQGKVRQVEQARYGFRVGTLNFLIRERTLSEVIERVPAYPIPNTPSWLLGLINLRGNLIPVFDLKRLFEMPPGDKDAGFVLVMDKGSQAVGMLIDGFPSTLRGLQAVAEMPPLPTALIGHVPAAYRREEEVWLELDHRGFFASLGTRIAG
jgi:twitching motility protein PilI